MKMRARNIVLLIIIVILVLFGILFFFDKIFDGGLIEPVNVECSTADDCKYGLTCVERITGKKCADTCEGCGNYCNNHAYLTKCAPSTENFDCKLINGVCTKITIDTSACDWRPPRPLIDYGPCKKILGSYFNGEKCVGMGGCGDQGDAIPFGSGIDCSWSCEGKPVCGDGVCDDQKVVLYLPNRVAKIKQGKDFGMAFGIKNVIKEQKFRWEIKVNDPDISRKCGVREQEAERWVTTGRVGRAEIASGQKYSNFATFNIPEGSVSDISTCIIRYKLVILEEDGGVYRVEPFDVDIV